jgi:hypothetical protein
MKNTKKLEHIEKGVVYTPKDIFIKDWKTCVVVDYKIMKPYNDKLNVHIDNIAIEVLTVDGETDHFPMGTFARCFESLNVKLEKENYISVTEYKNVDHE